MSEQYQDKFPDNPDQASYWNDTAGPKWVAQQAHMDLHLSLITDELLGRATPTAGETVLDVGCGTGGTTQALGQAVGTDGGVLGLDISEPMLAAATQRCADLAQVGFALGDAQSYALSRDAYDLLFSRFGVMFFKDPYAAFANLHSALKPGGRLAFACWAPLKENPWFALPMSVALRHLQKPEPMPPRAPGPLAFADPAYIEDILSRAGFGGITVESVTTGMPSSLSAYEQAEFLVLFGPVTRLIEAQQPAQSVIETLKAEMAEALAQYQTDSGLSVPATVYAVTAQRR